MDVPNLSPAWPSAVGPKIPELPNKSESSDLDSALACLRRELVSKWARIFYHSDFSLPRKLVFS